MIKYVYRVVTDDAFYSMEMLTPVEATAYRLKGRKVTLATDEESEAYGQG